MNEFYWINPFFGECESEPILRDAFNWLTAGIFKAMELIALEDEILLPWGDESSEILDLSYYANHSGGKFCSPIVKMFLSIDSMVDEDGKLTIEAVKKIARIIFTKYYIPWKNLWATNVAVYNPIHNYDMIENRIRKAANSEAEVFSGSKADTGSDTLQHGMIETTQHGMITDTTDFKFGINTTEDPKPSDASEYSEGGNTTVTDSGSDVTVKNLHTDIDNNKNSVGAEEENEEIHRAGNIGVTTTQKLIKEERELWVWNYFNQVFNDVDKELVLCFHDSCRV